MILILKKQIGLDLTPCQVIVWHHFRFQTFIYGSFGPQTFSQIYVRSQISVKVTLVHEAFEKKKNLTVMCLLKLKSTC